MSDKDLQAFASAQAKTAPNGAALSGSLSYGVQKDPEEEARFQKIAKRIGIGPQLITPEVQQSVTAQDAAQHLSTAPNMASWFHNPDNAALAHDDTGPLSAIEQAAQNGISVGTVTADPRSAFRRGYIDPALRTAQSFPPTRFAIGALGGTVGMLGNVGSFLGIHGDNGGPNAFQEVQRELDPSVTGASTVMGSRHLPFDTIAQNVGPLLPAAGVGIGTNVLTKALGLSERASALVGGANVGALFTADQGGQAYQTALQMGKTPAEARRIANRVALINAPVNVAGSAVTALPAFQKQGLASALGLGAGMGFSGQVGQNYIEGRPLAEGGLGAAVHGAAFQGGLHAAFGATAPIDHEALAVAQNQAYFQAIADPAQASKLAKRYGPAFEDAVAAATKDGPVQSVQIAPDKLMQYFQDQKIDPVQGAENLGIPNLPESLSAGTDAIIPISKFISKVAADPKAFEALRGDLRLGNGEMTLNESKAQPEASNAPSPELQKAAGEADQESKNPQLDAIHEDMRNRLIAAKMDPSTADAEATLWTSRIRVAAERSGMTPEELHQLYAPTVTRAGFDERTGTPLAETAVDRLAAAQEASPVQAEPHTGEPTIFGQGPAIHSYDQIPEDVRSQLHTGRQADEVNRLAGDAGLNPAHWRPFDAAKEDQGTYVQNRISDAMDHPEAFDKLYASIPETRGGKIMNGDVMEMLFTGNGDPKKGMEGVEPWAEEGLASTWLRMWKQKLADTPKGSEVWFTTGSPGAGKSVTAQGLVDRGDAALVYDNQGTSEGRLNIPAKMAEDAGMRVNIAVVKRNHAEAVAAMEKRAATELRALSPEGMKMAGEAAAKRVLALSKSPEGKNMRFWVANNNGTEINIKHHANDSSGLESALAASDTETGGENAQDQINPVGPDGTREEGAGAVRQDQRGNGAAGEASAAPGGAGIGQPLFQSPTAKVDTESPQFKKWFGGSKVVDESGSPLRVYHGTDAEFERFANEARGTSTGADSAKAAHWFVNDPEVADSYSNYAARDAKVQRALKVADEAEKRGDWDAYDKAVEAYEKLDAELGGLPVQGQRTVPVFLSIKNPAEFDAGGKPFMDIQDQLGKFIKAAKRNGNDGLIIKNLDDSAAFNGRVADHYAIFEPEQIKSAISNTGAFDPNNPNILNQSSKPLEFGSKEWNAYYAKNKGSFAPKDITSGRELTKKARAEMKKAMTKGGLSAEDARREEELRAEKLAYEDYRRQFADWEKGVKDIQAGTVHAAGDNRGFIQFGDDRKFQVGLLQNADLSTFSHETGHLWLEVMGDLAQKEGASDQLKSDYSKVLKFLGVDSRDQIGTEQHEKFARANEAYLREGNAPSEGLRSVFQRVKYWMAMIYRNAKDLNVKMNDDIRGVFDRMYASDSEIEQARKSIGDGDGLFAKPEDMGVSDAMFKKYLRATQDARATATDALQAQLAKEAAREKMAWWKDELGKTKEEVAKEVDSDPAQVAFKALSKGQTEDETPIKLNKEDLIYRYGDGVIKELPPTFGHLYAKEGGVDADTAADRLGFDSADQLIESLRNLEPRTQRINRIADLRMKEKHGDMMLDGTVSDKAAEALHNEHRETVLAMELQALRSKQAEVKPFADQAVKEAKAADKAKRQEAMAAIPKMEQFRDAAKGIIEQTAIKDLDPNRYLTTQRMKAREAYEAMGKGKYDQAADAKQKELLNHFLYREAVKAKAEADSIQRYGKKVSADAYRAKLGLAGERSGTNFLAQHDAILDRFDFRRATNKELDAKRQTLQQWADKMTAEGESPALTDEIINENYRKNYREMTVPELQAVKDALVNIGHLANEVNKVTIDGKKMDKDLVVSKIAAALEKNEGHKFQIPFDPNLKKSLAQKFGDKKRGIDALLIRMELLFKWADGGDVNGIVHKALWEPLEKAQADLGDLSREVTAKIQEAMETMPKDMRQRMQDTVDVEGLPAGTVTRKSILTMLLNMGNDSNFEKLTRGYGISPDAAFKAVGKLSKEEVQWAQHIWDTVGSLRPKIGDLERRTTGLEPKWVEVRPFDITLQNGEVVHLNGGYLPVKYDPRLTTVGERQITGDVSELTDSGFSRPSTPNGFTKPRTNFIGPILLDYEQVLLPHLSAVMKDLTHREAVKQVYQIISDDRVRKSFTEAFGKEYTDQLLPWLKTIVNDSNGASMKGLGLLDSGMRGIRRNTVAAAMGFRVSTALVQYTGITRSLHEVGTMPFAKAYGEFLTAPKKSFEWVNEVSGEMRNRAQNLDRDFREVHNRAVAGDIKGLKPRASELAFYGLHLTDIAISYPTWIARFRQSLAQGKDQATAIRDADQAVRLTQPTAAPKDLPPIMRNNETAKLITMFYGHFNLLYQNLRDTGHFVANAKNPAGERAMRAAKTALVSLILPALGEGLFRNPPGQDENYAEWLFLKSLHFGSASVPLLRELGKGIVDSIEGKRVDMKFSPMLETLSKVGRAVDDTHKAVAQEGDATSAIMSDLDAAGYLAGVPGTGQIMTTARYIRGRESGKIPSENPVSTVQHAAVGYPVGQKK